MSESTFYERIPTTVYQSAQAASKDVAREIAELIRDKAKSGEMAVLGLATGSTPVRVYSELIRMHQEEGLSFENVITFNLDEYFPMKPDQLQSYVRFMNEVLFDHVDIDPDNIYIPDGRVLRKEVHEYCSSYEEKIRKSGGIDIQLLGIGRTGHIGFNEPGSIEQTRTRLVTLDSVTRRDATADFFGLENVPRHAITMGVGSILDSKRIIMLAFGEHKAEIIARAVEGEVTSQVPATYLQNHTNARVIVDEGAAAELTRHKTPWLVRPCNWDEAQKKKAVVWLCRKLNKPILKLTDSDYNENGLSDLVTEHGPAYDINIHIFNKIQHTITGWPGGKPNADDTHRPERATPFPKRVLIFSPHPDDDVFCMGGTLARLVDHGHEVHLAYQTSGSMGVYDEETVRFVDFVHDYHEAFGMETSEVREVFNDIRNHIDNKAPEDADSEEVRKVKSLIRMGEAKSADRYIGVDLNQVYFLNMPFYETGRIRKKPLTDEDVDLVEEVIRKVRPHQIYAAGDLSDPHGTHRICLEAVKKALGRVKEEKWIDDCYVWFYRGAWQEWEAHEIDMAVPLSPGEVMRKRRAVFKHESQKDRPLFPGNDPREFWVRVDERARKTADTYDQLGLAEYEAIEGFVRRKISDLV